MSEDPVSNQAKCTWVYQVLNDHWKPQTTELCILCIVYQYRGREVVHLSHIYCALYLNFKGYEHCFQGKIPAM